ncbi:kinase-like protein [Aureobasidium pullulans]|uniref:Kinase-like protein n=1 Tax=Aureobasidium pullulans TaxID=5580 RepID=A0A4S9WT64_AURPU|nr:kinase-like protein [Aureobasidium pullulans]
MSSFFRSAADISSSREDSSTSDGSSDESDSSDQQITRIRTLGSSTTGAEEQSEPGASQALAEGSRSSSYHRDLLLHALLEERCYNEALDDLKAAGVQVESKNNHRVQTLAKEKYTRLSRQLGRYGLETGDLDSDQFGALRQTYRDGLSVITRKSVDLQTPIEEILAQSQGSNVPGPLLRLMGGEPSATIDMSRRFSDLAIAGSDLHAQPKLLGNGILPGHPLLNSTRYTRDFEEFGILGKGGYGTVFRCKHNLDGRHYAIKKIPLGPTRMRKIQENGQAELDHILVEVRTLARLEHPNIVRYHSGWIEWAPLLSAKQAIEHNGRKLLEAPRDSQDNDDASAQFDRPDIPAIDVQFGYDDDDDDPFDMSTGQSATQRFATQEEEDILFEESSRRSGPATSDTQSLQPGSYSEGAPLQKIPSRGTVASVSDESEVEVITRREDPSSSYDTSSFSTNANHHHGNASEPSLALHIQMSLYSMTLSDFMSPTTYPIASSDIASLRHCFHAHSSLEILSSIVEGVEYLHSEGIVHRDLKPGNIFLAVRGGSKPPPGALSLSTCTSCHATDSTRPFNISICIGDFGLVSAIARPEDEVPSKAAKAVGTEIYRPYTVTRDNHPSLDVYALGIIAFELLHPFGTRMERHEMLHKLKKGEISDELDGNVGCEGMGEWIRGMVGASESCCPGWEKLRGELRDLLEKCKGLEGKGKEKG